jgi:hypothetical protein
MSKRLSRDPIGWSVAALGKMACARVYRENGGELSSTDLRKEAAAGETYRQYAERISEEYLKGAFDFSIFEPELPIMDGASGTQLLLDKIGRPKSLLA